MGTLVLLFFINNLTMNNIETTDMKFIFEMYNNNALLNTSFRSRVCCGYISLYYNIREFPFHATPATRKCAQGGRISSRYKKLQDGGKVMEEETKCNFFRYIFFHLGYYMVEIS